VLAGARLPRKRIERSTLEEENIPKTIIMESKKDHPGIYLPPPVIYIGTFLAALLLQKLIPFNKEFFHTTTSKLFGAVIIFIGLGFSFQALRQFFKTKNSLVTIKPANSLQTTGIYSVSRNPMYVSLLLLYTGLSFIIGNWWNLILLPVLFVVVQEYVIKHEEKYLDRRFGEQYFDYKTKVRRWL
jgi:protein-S-isoprenylcysteine O-methyltransferase Ste14